MALWRQFLLSFMLGLLGALAMPPLYYWPCLLVSLIGCYAMARRAGTARGAFLHGWLWGLGYLTASLYWISWALTVDLARYGWLLPLAMLGLPALFAIYFGVAAAVYQRCQKFVGGPVFFMLLWWLAELARGYFFTGLPWNLFGMTWLGNLALAQSASLWGIYGLSLLTLLTAGLLGEALLGAGKARLGMPLLAALLMGWGALWWWGEARLADGAPAAALNATPVQLRVVQPSISPKVKWSAEYRENNFQTLLRLTSAPAPVSPNIIVWPETALDYRLAANSFYRQQLARALPPDSILLTGTIRHDAQGQAYNSMIALDAAGATLGHYDKTHLVPFGEYVPLRSFGPVAALAAGVGAFTPGAGRTSWQLPAGPMPPFSPLICYEIIFPGAVLGAGVRPQAIINITNDSWYERTAGPHQHLAQTRMRAIEEGLPVIRAANTGISAIIDAQGRVLQQLGLFVVGSLDAALPPALPATLFNRYGFVILIGLFMANIMIAYVFRVKEKVLVA